MNPRRSTTDVAHAIQRLIQALGRRVGNEDAADLAHFPLLQDELQAQFTQAVEQLRRHGVTDGQIAEALRVSRQAVSKRWPDHGRRVGAAGVYGRRPDRRSEKTERRPLW